MPPAGSARRPCALVADGYRVVAVDACLGADHGLAWVDYPLASRDDLAELSELGDCVMTYVADVRDSDALRAGAGAAVERWGRLARGLAADLVGTGVTAVAVSPGATRTAMLDATARIYGLDDPADLAAHQLSRRVHDPDEVAATIVHCCSVAGGLLNGSVVEVGGGST